MAAQSLQDFIIETSQKPDTSSIFQLESNGRVLEAHVNGRVWSKVGSMLAYKGNVKFTREGIMEHGLEKMFKEAVTGKGMSLMKAEGEGVVYFGDGKKYVNIIKLAQNESLSINGRDILAFEPSLNWDIKLIRRMAGVMTGSLFNVTFNGEGLLAFTTHAKPLTLRVTPESPVFTDPDATVAWTSNLDMDFKTDFNLGTFLGRSSGESVQLQFKGDGIVVVQPSERFYSSSNSSLDLAGLI
jgi:uncharacterized protein (AIM24 family)